MHMYIYIYTHTFFSFVYLYVCLINSKTCTSWDSAEISHNAKNHQVEEQVGSFIKQLVGDEGGQPRQEMVIVDTVCEWLKI